MLFQGQLWMCGQGGGCCLFCDAMFRWRGRAFNWYNNYRMFQGNWMENFIEGTFVWLLQFFWEKICVEWRYCFQNVGKFSYSVSKPGLKVFQSVLASTGSLWEKNADMIDRRRIWKKGKTEAESVGNLKWYEEFKCQRGSMRMSNGECKECWWI